MLGIDQNVCPFLALPWQVSILKILDFCIFQAACFKIFMFRILVIAVTMQVSLVEPAVVGTVSS